LTLQFKQVIYQIQTNRPTYALRNAQVTVCENPQGEIIILYKNQSLEFSLFQPPPRQAEVVTSKTLDQQLQHPKPPAANHPWRQYGHPLNSKPVQETTANGAD
jgi:hypothetical protein